jgi:hypothetical protein
MKLFTILLFLVVMPAFGMGKQKSLPEFMRIDLGDSRSDPLYESPGQLIEHHIQSPTFIHNQLEKYPAQQLLTFRYFQHNNLLHILVKTLNQRKDSLENFDQLISEYKPVFECLVRKGLDINEVNDDRKTPFILMVKAQDKRLKPLENFLTDKLGAHLTYVSIAPELRFFWNIITCNSCRKPKYS